MGSNLWRLFRRVLDGNLKKKNNYTVNNHLELFVKKGLATCFHHLIRFIFYISLLNLNRAKAVKKIRELYQTLEFSEFITLEMDDG